VTWRKDQGQERRETNRPSRELPQTGRRCLRSPEARDICRVRICGHRFSLEVLIINAQFVHDCSAASSAHADLHLGRDVSLARDTTGTVVINVEAAGLTQENCDPQHNSKRQLSGLNETQYPQPPMALGGAICC